MYVGVTYTGNGPYRSEVPAVSSRSLDSASLFQVRGMDYFLVGLNSFLVGWNIFWWDGIFFGGMEYFFDGMEYFLVGLNSFWRD